MSRPLQLIMLLITLISCKENQEVIQENIFRDVISETYIKLSKDFKNISTINKVIVNPINDHLDSLMILRVKNDSSSIDPRTMELFNRLEKILNEPIRIDLRKMTEGQKFQLIDNKTEINTFDYDQEDFVGVSSLSKIAIADDNEHGIFYIDLQFGKSRGHGGFFIFVKKENDKWFIADVWQVWS